MSRHLPCYHRSIMAQGGTPGPTDADSGLWRGKRVARRFVSPDGWVVLVGRTAADNDILTFKLAAQRDFWLHIAGQPGSHVVVRNPDGAARLPRQTERFAASLAAGYSQARRGGRVKVHLARRSEIRKPRGAGAGKVALGKYRSIQAEPRRED